MIMFLCSSFLLLSDLLVFFLIAGSWKSSFFFFFHRHRSTVRQFGRFSIWCRWRTLYWLESAWLIWIMPELKVAILQFCDPTHYFEKVQCLWEGCCFVALMISYFIVRASTVLAENCLLVVIASLTQVESLNWSLWLEFWTAFAIDARFDEILFWTTQCYCLHIGRCTDKAR